MYRDHYERIQGPGWKAIIRRDWRDVIGSDPTVWFDEVKARPGEVLRLGGGQGVTSVREINGRRVFCKLYLPGNIHRRFRDLFIGPRVFSEWESTARASDIGIRVPDIVLALTRTGILGSHHLLVTLPVAGEQIHAMLKAMRKAGESQIPILRILGERVGEFHRMGFAHAHLNAQHLFLTPEGGVSVIDLEKCLIAKPLPEKDRLRNLRQLDDSLRKALADRSQFSLVLDSYREVLARG